MWRATKAQLLALREILDRYPGDFEVQLQILPEDSYPPHYPGKHVKPTDDFIAEVKAVMKADIEISDHDASPFLSIVA